MYNAPFGFVEKNGSIVPCTKGCHLCSDTRCLETDDGYVIVGNDVQACDANCKTCMGPNFDNCSSCEGDRILAGSTCMD